MRACACASSYGKNVNIFYIFLIWKKNRVILKNFKALNASQRQTLVFSHTTRLHKITQDFNDFLAKHMKWNKDKRREDRLIVASRFTIEDMIQCWLFSFLFASAPTTLKLPHLCRIFHLRRKPWHSNLPLRLDGCRCASRWARVARKLGSLALSACSEKKLSSHLDIV